ncbi:hypothetical protein BX600DRAFT_515333 [Xylariales sp. PMI_506]|nr:hypothetical protein BX600DRAFT_515333 [Xylariales sp. PMI_506]
MEFMRGNINEFMDTLNTYKMTISIALGTVAMENSKVTQKFIKEFNDTVENTLYQLGIRLQRIEKNLETSVPEHPTAPEDSNIDLRDEKAVIEQCVQICQSAVTYARSLENEQPVLQEAKPQEDTGYIEDEFEARVKTRRVFGEFRDNLEVMIGEFREHLKSVAASGGADHEKEKVHLQRDMHSSNQLVELCKEAAIFSQKIHIVGDVEGNENCDLVVVTTFADLFKVGKVKDNKNGRHMIGSMERDALIQVSKDLYTNPPATVDSPTSSVKPHDIHPIPAKASRQRDAQVREGQASESGSNGVRPSPNEVRRRKTANDDRKDDNDRVSF